MNKWYTAAGENSDVVLSTRVRLARNIREYPFPARLDEKSATSVCEKVRDALFSGNSKMAESFTYTPMSTFSETQAVSLAEHHLISPEFARGAAAGRSFSAQMRAFRLCSAKRITSDCR